MVPRGGVSAPRNWNQGKAEAGSVSVAQTSVRPSELESRQSKCPRYFTKADECPPLGIGIKAKRTEPKVTQAPRVSAPRNWNQGKASKAMTIELIASVRPSELESRQSGQSPAAYAAPECPPLGIGIKAKRKSAANSGTPRVSAPRNWNQGKASANQSTTAQRSVRPSELESRQSGGMEGNGKGMECPPLGIGIKAKRQPARRPRRGRVSAPRNWNQGKAP